LATAATPSVPPPPGRFSMTKGWPTCFDTCSSVMRPIRSLALPAVNGLITWTDRVGQGDCARAADVPAASIAPDNAPSKIRNEAICPSLDFGDRMRVCGQAFKLAAIGGRGTWRAPRSNSSG
jgi:hypothetical protein